MLFFTNLRYAILLMASGFCVYSVYAIVTNVVAASMKYEIFRE